MEKKSFSAALTQKLGRVKLDNDMRLSMKELPC